MRDEGHQQPGRTELPCRHRGSGPLAAAEPSGDSRGPTRHLDRSLRRDSKS